MIKVDDLQVKYGDFVAIDNVDFNIKQGEFFTLLGPSGCGKTTTLRAIAGFNPITKGRIAVDGKEISNIPVEKRGLGMVFQSYALFPTMTVHDNIAYGLQVEKMAKSDINKRVSELAELVELNSDQLKRNVSELSGGQQQRVAIARALAKRPNVVLFDEPLSNLDAKLRKQLRAELKSIQRNTGMTAIYVTHDQEEALEMSDKIAVFNNGHIEQVGTPKEIYNHSATEFVCNFIGNANKLSDEVVNYLSNKINTDTFNVAKAHYIREEKIKLTPHTRELDSLVELPVTIINESFRGVITAYECQFGSSIIRVVNKEDGLSQFDIGDEVTLYIDPSDILSYEVN